jgi:hypothetical protein
MGLFTTMAATPSRPDPKQRLASPCTACPGCGVVLPSVLGAEHPYMTGSSACWAAYGELLAAQFSSPGRMQFHQIVVDAYAVQHPGTDDRRAIQSVALHLMTLYLFLERGTDPIHGTRLHKHMVQRPVFHFLHPPASRGRRTHLDVPRSGAESVARDVAYAWARDAWGARSPHHATVRGWVVESGLEAAVHAMHPLHTR